MGVATLPMEHPIVVENHYGAVSYTERQPVGTKLNFASKALQNLVRAGFMKVQGVEIVKL